MVETTPTKTRRKKTKTTVAAMIVIATIISFPLAANQVAFAAGTPPSTSGSTMLKFTRNSFIHHHLPLLLLLELGLAYSGMLLPPEVVY
jgi:hypothetical protein